MADINADLLKKLFKNQGIVETDSTVEENFKFNRIKTISPSVNWILQGGIVPGKFYCFFGPESSGKTMFAVSVCAELLRQDPSGVIIWFDAERSLYDNRHWINVFMSDERGFTEEDRRKRFVVKPVSFGRDIFDSFSKEIVQYHDNGLKILGCVIDSVQAITPPVEENRESTEDQTMAALARYLPGALRHITDLSRDRNIPWIFICQTRIQMDQMKQRMGQKYSLSGGKAIMHGSDCVMLFEPMEGKAHKIYDETKTNMDGHPIQIGASVKVAVMNKSRVGAPNRVAIIKYLYKTGITDVWEEVANLALSLGVVTLQGKTYFYGDMKLGVGQSEYEQRVKTDLALQEQLIQQMYQISLE